MRCLVFGVLFVALPASGPSAQSDRPMFPLQDVPGTSGWLSGLHTADVDADGDLDLLTAAGSLAVRLGDGDGYFPQAVTTPVSGSTQGLAVGDIDADGLPDVALASLDDNGVAILLGSGDGSFTPSAIVPAGNTLREPVLGDFDGDGDLDLAVVRSGTSGLVVSLGDGRGGFGPVTSLATAATSANDLAAADLDQDGDLDLVVAFSTSASLQVFHGDGRGGFAAQPLLPLVNVASDVLAADLTGDGRPDLVASHPNAAIVSLLSGQPEGFAPAQTWGPALGGSPHSLAAADVDNDGDLDLAVGTALTFSVDRVKLLVNEGGASATLVQVPAGFDIGPVALADVNGDGLIDLLASSADGSSGITVVLNALDPWFEAPTDLSIPPLSVRALAHGDVDGDGQDELLALATESSDMKVLALRVPELQIVAEAAINVSGTLPDSLWAGDLDGDGLADLAVADVSADTVVVVPGQAGGGFGAHLVVAASVDPDFVAGGDVDADGDLDLVTTNRFQDQIGVLWNDGTGAFSAPLVLNVADAPRRVAIGDLDQDGLGDLAIIHVTGSNLSLLFGAGQHAFEPPVQLAIGTSPDDVEAADLDLDGDLDLAVADAGGLRLMKGLGGGAFTTVAVIPAGATNCVDVGDVDGDGLPDVVTDGVGQAGFVVYTGATALAPQAAFNSQAFEARVLMDADDDGLLDLVLGGNHSQGEFQFHWNVSDQHGPLEDVGQGLAGSNGTPHWSGLGTLQPQTALALTLAHAQPGAPLTLVLGTSVLEAPFKGGTMVPQPQLLIAGLAANATGALALSTTWPAGIPSGFLLATQCWIVDPAGPAGLSASNGLVLTAP